MKEDIQYHIIDYTQVYSRIMQFDKNKSAFIHQWYPFVEGYSKDFISSIINELDYEPEVAFDPFAGSGTTPLEMQDLGIKCYSFEVSPFMYKLATVKLERSYTKKDFTDALILVGNILEGDLLPIRSLVSPPMAKTFQPKKGLKKWIFNRSAMSGILDIKYAIKKIEDEKYQNLFEIALASILLDISNAYRDGKSLKYKKGWDRFKITRREVHSKFLDRLNNVFLPDIEKLELQENNVENRSLCFYGDVRKEIEKIPDNSIELVVTSPPYLNSRDYTDIYIAELWILDLVKDYEELRNLRKNTLRSHVQIKHGEVDILESIELSKVIIQLQENMKSHWNPELLSMIKGYFQDMNTLFEALCRKMKPGKKVFFNVANSAYYGVEIKVDVIVSEIAEKCGFVVDEIRKARDLRPSSQQKDLISSLRETVIVMTNK